MKIREKTSTFFYEINCIFSCGTIFIVNKKNLVQNFSLSVNYDKL